MKPGNMRTIFFLIGFVFINGGNLAYGSEAKVTLSIDTAVSIALEENLNIKLKKNEVKIRQGIELLENSAFDPLLEADISNAEQKMTSLLVGGADSEKSLSWIGSVKKKMETGTELSFLWENGRFDTDSALVVQNPSYRSSVGISISHPLIRGNSKEIQTAGVRVAEKFTEAATFMVADQAASLAADVKNAYWELVFARQEIDVKNLSLKLAETLREETIRKIESGIMAKVEIYQPDSEIARREEQLIAAERNIANAEDVLKQLLNQKNWFVSLVPRDIPETTAHLPDLQEVLNIALSNKPNIKAGDLLVNANEILVSKAEDDIKPLLALNSTAGIQGIGDNFGKTLDNTFSDSDFSWQVSLTFQLPIGNKAGRGDLKRARGELSTARYKAERLRQEMVQSVRGAVRDINLALKAIEATRKTSLAAQKRLEAEQEKFKVGLATANDVLEFQDSYAQALISEKRALINLAKARADLDRVQGIVSFRNQQGNDISFQS